MKGHAIVFLSDSLDGDEAKLDNGIGRLTGGAVLAADAAAAAAAAKNGDGAAAPAKAANPAADGPLTLKIPKLCIAAACTNGGREAIRIFSTSAS